MLKHVVASKFKRAKSVPELRRTLDRLARFQRIPSGVEVQRALVGGCTAEWVRTTGAQPDRAILYLHGGAFVMGSPTTHRELAARISVAARAMVLVPDYRLAPEHPFPAAVHDAVSAYRWLISALEANLCPMRALVLGSGIRTFEINRPDECTLLVRPEDGFLALPGSSHSGHEAAPPLFDRRYMFPFIDRLYCGNRTWMVGQRFNLGYVVVEITAITDDGRPAEAAYRFNKALESRFFRWIQWEDGAYVPFPLPAVGETVTLPPFSSPDWEGHWLESVGRQGI